jgi:hypothetical protein
MAKVLYIQYLADGTTKTMCHATKQGAPVKPVEIRKVYKTYMICPASLPIIKEKAKSMGLSISAYVDLAAVLYNP